MRQTDDLTPTLYEELRKLAIARLAKERPDHTLQPTELVAEVVVRLSTARAEKQDGWNSRGHYFGAAARSMRQVLIDYAKRRSAAKRPQEKDRVVGLVTLPNYRKSKPLSIEEILALEQVLSEFEAEYPREANIVSLRYFAGLEVQEIADALGTSKRRVERDWTFAKGWLRRRLSDHGGPGD